MDAREFFKSYLPALEKALESERTNQAFDALGPDWYIEDERKREKMYLFEEKNFEQYKSIFEKVALYFDAISHGFKEIDGINIEQFKEELKWNILMYREKYVSPQSKDS